MSNSPRDVLKSIEQNGVQMIDFRFTDVPGTWRHVSVPAKAIDEGALLSGIAFEGVPLPGARAIGESGLLLKPDLATAHLDAFRSATTLSLICDVVDPVEKAPYESDPRRVARRAADYLKTTGIADTASFGAAAEFFILDGVSYENHAHASGYAIDRDEDSPRPDRFTDLLGEMALELDKWGIEVAMQHRDGAGTGKARIDVGFDSLLETADRLMIFKYVVKNVAARNGKTATFMPKPRYGGDGAGMPCGQSLWKDGRPLFYDAAGYAECSKTMLNYIGGLLTHAGAVLAFAAPTTNSYKRLASHLEAPVDVAFSTRNRFAAVHVPTLFHGDPKAKRLEFRPPDSSANPYLAFAAMLLAGIDGIKKQIDPIKAGFGPLDRSSHDLPRDEAAKLRTLPRSLAASLEALSADRAFLLEGGVFSDAFVDEWIAYKYEKEVEPLERRPHPYEFALYLDA